MFPCCCSLRSTQCAALIALATLTGIARVEPGKALSTVETPRDQAVEPAASVAATSRAVVFFQAWVVGARSVAATLSDQPVRYLSDAASQQRGHCLPRAVTPVRDASGFMAGFEQWAMQRPTPMRAARILPLDVPFSARRQNRLPYPVGPPTVGSSVEGGSGVEGKGHVAESSRWADGNFPWPTRAAGQAARATGGKREEGGWHESSTAFRSVCDGRIGVERATAAVGGVRTTLTL
jgi:hypothetical protein